METKDSELVHIAPDPVGAMLAVSLASDMLDSARENLYKNDFDQTMENSLHSIRAAASAILLKQGHIASTFEATYGFLYSNFPHELSLDSWKSLETSSFGTNRGMAYSIFKTIGIIKKTDEQQAKQALKTAEKFLDSVQDILGRIP